MLNKDEMNKLGITEYQHMAAGTPIPYMYNDTVQLHIGDRVQGTLYVEDFKYAPCGAILPQWKEIRVVGVLRFMTDTCEVCVVTGGIGSNAFNMRFKKAPIVVRRWDDESEEYEVLPDN